jgi:hypothetical protein
MEEPNFMKMILVADMVCRRMKSPEKHQEIAGELIEKAVKSERSGMVLGALIALAVTVLSALIFHQLPTWIIVVFALLAFGLGTMVGGLIRLSRAAGRIAKYLDALQPAQKLYEQTVKAANQECVDTLAPVQERYRATKEAASTAYRATMAAVEEELARVRTESELKRDQLNAAATANLQAAKGQLTI